MDRETFVDRSHGYSCPNCTHTHQHTYMETPNHRREFLGPNGEECTIHMPAVRDYECGSCGFEWSMDVDQEQ